MSICDHNSLRIGLWSFSVCVSVSLCSFLCLSPPSRLAHSKKRSCKDIMRRYTSASKEQRLLLLDLDLGLPVSRTLRKKYVLFKPPGNGFFYGNLSTLTRGLRIEMHCLQLWMSELGKQGVSRAPVQVSLPAAGASLAMAAGLQSARGVSLYSDLFFL